MSDRRAFMAYDIENQIPDADGKVAGKIYEKQVTLSSAQILDLTTPKELVPAPGVGRLLEFVAAIMKHNAGAAYVEPSPGDDCVIQYGSGQAVSADIDTTGFLDQTDDEIRYVPTNVGLTTDLEASVNYALQLHNLDEEYTTGTGTLDIRVMYRIHDFRS